MKLPRRLRSRALAGGGLFGALVLGAAIVAATTPPADLAARTDVTNLAFDALSREADMFLGNDTAGLSSRFTGAALEGELVLQAHVQDLINQGTDYPGPLHISDQKVLSISGGGDFYVIEVQFHAVRDNMRAGKVIDQSESDVIWTLSVARAATGWRISSMDGRFAPGGGP
ncbi:MAG: hypothetical protein V4515_05835 [Chloroflexota bacterium]